MAKTLTERRNEAYEAAKAFRAQHGDNMTDEQLNEFKGLIDTVDELDVKMAYVHDREAASARLDELEQKSDARAEKRREDIKAATLGEHFVKHAAEAGALTKGANGGKVDFAAPIFGTKAASDPLKVTGSDLEQAGYNTTFDRTIVNQKRQELVMADIMGNARITTGTIQYLVEKAQRIAEGAPKTVAEGAKKPYVRYNEFDIITESLTKVAALTKITTEMLEDLPFVVDWINNQLIYDLSVAEENQILSGDGNGSNMTGLLNRSGIQEHTIDTQEGWFDGLYESGAKVRRFSPFKFDAFVMNDIDYQVLRLAKDGNGQYLAGGPFQGQYGNGGIMIDPPLWGKRVVTTDEIEVGTALVGAFKQGSILLRRGGVRVDLATQNATDFEDNLATLRAEERLGLMVPVPSAFVKVTLGGATEVGGA